MNKIVRAAEEAVKIARCDHEKIIQPRLRPDSKMDRFYCHKCGAMFYEPVER